MIRLTGILLVGAPLLLCQTPTTITIASSLNPSVFGQAVTLSASVSPSQATGRVTFYDGTVVLGIAPVADGAASLSVILPSSGVRTLAARFSGTGGYGSSLAPAFTQTVNVERATTLRQSVAYPTASTISPIAVADFNGDGHLDIVTNDNSVLMGNGDGTFQKPVNYAGVSYSVVAGDFNGDGKPDFAAARADGNVGVWLNKDDGTFQPPVLTFGGTGVIAAGDFNNDGIIDLAIASPQGQSGIGILLGNGDGTFQPVTSYLNDLHPMALAIADFNGDGNADIVTVDNEDVGQPLTILLGAGDGTFRTGDIYQALFPTFVATGDFNNDGRADFAVINRGHLSVFLGKGDGTFSERPRPPTWNSGRASGTWLVVADFDGDGNQDLAYTGSGTNTISMFLGMGDGTFRGAVNLVAGSDPTSTLAAADFNEDGRTDLAGTSSISFSASSLQILLGATGDFPAITTASLPAATTGISYSSTLTASGGTTPYTWSVSAGTLPTGLGLYSDGTVAGTPPANIVSMPYSFTAMVSGPDGPGFFSSQNYSIDVAPQILTRAMGFAVGVSSTFRLLSTGGIPPVQNWTIVSGSLPPGLALDSASGNISGVPTVVGTFSITLTVTDSAGVSSAPTMMVVTVEAVPAVTTMSLPMAMVGIPYNAKLTATSGTPPYTFWSISSGALPPGLMLDSSTGAISGTPISAAGIYSFSIVAGDFYDIHSAPQSLTITVENSQVQVFSYFMPHLAFGGGYQTTLTLVNYSPQAITCETTFYSDSGGALQVPFPYGVVSSRSDTLAAGATIHVQTQADATAPVSSGWAEAQCTGPLKAGLLFRLYSGAIAAADAQGEAGVNASTTPATEFVTFAETQTGIAYANPSAAPATVTITALDSSGTVLGSTSFELQPNAHAAANIGPLLHLNSFTGSVQITSTEPIVSLSLNAEAFPVFSSLPPGDLPDGTPLGNATETAAPQNGPASTYYFPHLAFGGGYQTTLTYVNYSQQAVSCQTTFYSDSGGALQVPFAGGAVSSRSDQLAPGGSLHVQTQADAGGATTSGWAQAQCTGPVKASLLFRLYSDGIAQGEAGVHASTAGATEFVTFAQTQTGIAYANPSSTPATVTFTVLDSSGALLPSRSLVLQPNAHGAATVGPFLNLSGFRGSVQITSTAPIVTLSLNAEAFPVFSSLPPGDLPASTPLTYGQ